MDRELGLRIAVGIIVLLSVSISASFRWKARRHATPIPRGAEDRGLIALRLLVAVPLYGGLLAYLGNPRWMAWAHVDLPAWVRWGSVAVAALLVPFLYWTLRSLGPNVSETVLTREGQRLVSWGPYRRVRHPLYSGATLALAALALAAANWFLGLMVAVVAVLLPSLAKREEAQLLARFGSAYADYMAGTGRFLPRVGAGHRVIRSGAGRVGGGGNG